MAQTAVRENLARIQDRISNAAARAGRKSEEVTLIAVSKTHPADAVHEAYEAGVRHFGENRVQEWEGKHAKLQDLDATWHLIGHLQSNKANKAARLFHAVDSVDDIDVAQRLDRAREELGLISKLRVLLEVKIGDEAAKSGVSVTEVRELAEKICALPHLELAGLMCIPPFLENAEKVRPFFRKLRELRETLEGQLGRKLPVLSMGMSHDFEVAIEEGASEVRIGTAIFGKRENSKV